MKRPKDDMAFVCVRTKMLFIRLFAAAALCLVFPCKMLYPADKGLKKPEFNSNDEISRILLLERAHRFYDEARYDDALALYKHFYKRYPFEPDTLLFIASLYEETGDYQEAINYFKRYLSVIDEPAARLALSEVYYCSGRLDDALKAVAALEHTYPVWRTFLLSGLVYEARGDNERALKKYSRSLALKESSIALYRRGKIYFFQGQYERAIGEFSRLIAFDPSIRLAYYYLGRAYLNEHNGIQAYRYLDRARGFYPRNSTISKELQFARNVLGEDYFAREHAASLKRRRAFILPSYTPPPSASPHVAVGIISRAGAVHFKSARSITVSSPARERVLAPDRFYTLSAEQKRVRLLDYDTKEVIGILRFPVSITSQGSPFYVLGVRFGKDEFWNASVDMMVRGSLRILQNQEKLTVVNILSLEEYLYGVLPSEISPHAPFEALKAQAVAARTLAYRNKGRHRKEGFDFCAGVHCQAYRGMRSETDSVRRAVDETYAEAMFFEGEPVEAFYHANCGGCLRADIFGSPAYLKRKLDREENTLALFSPWDARQWFWEEDTTYSRKTPREPNFRWQRMYDADDFAIAFGFPLDSVREVRILEKGDCEHIKEICVDTLKETFSKKGDLAIRRFFDNLRSSAFKLSLIYRADKRVKTPVAVLIRGGGFGHGAGMSQEGMTAMARQGARYRQILRHYYPGVTFQKAY